MAGLPSEKSTTSFWHSEPSHFLLDHHTTSEVPAYADIVIVGSGITGTSAARYLAEDGRAEGQSVLMLDAREACWGATGRNGGHCQPLHFDSTPDVASFEVKNYSAVKSYIEQHDIPCEWRSLPGCRTFWSKQLADAVAREVQKLKQAVPELGRHVTLIDNEDELQKYRVNGAHAATITTSAGSLWPYKYVTFILEKLIKEEKLNLQTNTPVTSIAPSQDGKARHALCTPRGTIKAHHVILSTNAYTSHLLPEFTDLIVPERGVVTALLPPKGMEHLATSYGFVGVDGSNPTHDDYLNQRPFSGVHNPAGHLMFGGGRVAAELDSIGEYDDSVIDEGSAAWLRKALPRLLTLGGEVESSKELEATHQWSGIWGDSKDRHPWVGEVPDRKGVWLAGGYSGHGMPNASLCGKALVEMVLDEGNGVSGESVSERLIKSGDLPQAYLITKERVDRAKAMDSVKVQDEAAELGDYRIRSGLDAMRLV